MIDSLLHFTRLAFSQLFSKSCRKLFWKLIGCTIVVLIIVWFLLQSFISIFLLPFLVPWPWMVIAVTWLMGIGMFIGAGFLIAPISAMLAGIFLDDIALEVEKEHYPYDLPGNPLPSAPSLWLAIKFTALVIMANLIALLLVLLPGINFTIFFLLNGYLLGREYFQFVAMRFINEQEANNLRRTNEGNVFLGGLIIACFLAIPLLNLLTPIFAATLMVHIYKHLCVKKPIHQAQ